MVLLVTFICKCWYFNIDTYKYIYIYISWKNWTSHSYEIWTQHLLVSAWVTSISYTTSCCSQICSCSSEHKCKALLGKNCWLAWASYVFQDPADVNIKAAGDTHGLRVLVSTLPCKISRYCKCDPVNKYDRMENVQNLSNIFGFITFLSNVCSLRVQMEMEMD